MKKIALTSCMLFGMMYLIHAQIVTIKDIETSRPLEMVTLHSETPKTFVTTNADGQADISKFKGSEKIGVQMLGFKFVTMRYAEMESLNFEVRLEPSNLNLDEVVISATKWKQSSYNIPFKITTIVKNDVTMQNPQTAADLLEISGKVYIQKSQQGGGSPMIRGFATNRLLYMVDGVRMNTAIFRGGNLQNVISLDPFVTESAEVLFGPGSVMYGSDAIGGVMSFQTLTPQLSLTDKPLIAGKALTRYSSANSEKSGHFDVSVGWKKWAFVSSFSTWDYDHLRQGSHGPDDYLKTVYVQRQNGVDHVITQDNNLLQIPSAYSQDNMMQKIRFQPNENWNFEYGFHYSETSPYGRYDRNARFKDGMPRYAEWNYGPQKWMMNNLSLNHKGNKFIYDELTLRIAQQRFEESRMDRSFNKTQRSTNTENVEAYSLNLDFTKSLGDKNILFYGAEYIYNDVESSGNLKDIINGEESKSPSRYPNSTWSSLAVYMNDEFKVSKKLTALAGLRFNLFALKADFSNNLDFYPFPFSKVKIDDNSVTGSIGTVYRPTQSWVLSVNFGTAFRSPNVDDVGKVFDSEPGAVTVPNPNLKAEYAYNLDVGITKVFDDLVKIDVTAYYTTLQNALVRRDFQLGGRDSLMYDGQMSKIQAIQNASVANVYGVQAGLELKLPQGFSFSSNINYQHGQEELDDGSTSPSRHAAPLFGTSRFNYKADKLHLQFYASYQSQRKHEDLAFEEQGKDEIYAKDKNGNTYSPAWCTFNVKSMYDLSESFTVSAGLENLTGKRYRPYSSGISAPGRNFILSLIVNF